MNNRTIKFRLWTGEKFLTDEYFFIQNGKTYEHLEFEGYEPIEGKLSQFTGVYEKNNKEIFEGDIVRFGDAICTIIFVTGAFFIQLRDGSVTHICNATTALLDVVGNIFQDQDLLNK